MAVHPPELVERTENRAESASAPTGNADSVLPAPEQKHAYVQSMFDAIAPRYDLLNSVLSARMHHGWRRAAVAAARLEPGDVALDVCTGTGDLAFALARVVGAAGSVVGTDFSRPMVEIGAAKARQRVRADNTSRGDHADVIRWGLADTQALPFPAHSFDAVTVGFGIRNVADLQAGLNEMARVTRPGGRVVILEFNQPRSAAFAALYRFYSFRLLPLLGGLISGRRAAYEYLPSSVAAFPSREAIADRMRLAGLDDVHFEDRTLGVVVIHSGVKSAVQRQAAPFTVAPTASVPEKESSR